MKAVENPQRGRSIPDDFSSFVAAEAARLPDSSSENSPKIRSQIGCRANAPRHVPSFDEALVSTGSGDCALEVLTGFKAAAGAFNALTLAPPTLPDDGDGTVVRDVGAEGTGGGGEAVAESVLCTGAEAAALGGAEAAGAGAGSALRRLYVADRLGPPLSITLFTEACLRSALTVPPASCGSPFRDSSCGSLITSDPRSPLTERVLCNNQQSKHT